MKAIRNVTLICVGLTACFIAVIYLFSAGIINVHREGDVSDMSALEMMDYYTREDKDVDNDDSFIKMAIPEGVMVSDIDIEISYVNNRLTVSVPGITEDYFYENPLVGGTEGINDVNYFTNKDGAGFEIIFDNVFEVKTEIRDGDYYIFTVDPRTIYDTIIVIDPGHGGNSSPGTVRQDIRECDIDLSIGLYLKELFEEAGDDSIGVYFTRTTDVDTSLASRVGLANNLNADLFVSIHNNAINSLKMDDTVGTEVLYNDLDETGKSYRFAEICLEEVSRATGFEKRSLLEGNDILVVRSSKVPVALIEVGFMSNKDELDKLNDSVYQKKAAEGIYEAIMRALEEGI